MCVKTMGQKVYTCAHVWSARLLNSLLQIVTSHMLCVDFFLEVHCVYIHYHSHTYIRHRDIAPLLLRRTSVNA